MKPSNLEEIRHAMNRLRAKASEVVTMSTSAVMNETAIVMDAIYRAEHERPDWWLKAQKLDAEPEGYKHIINASDGVTTIVVDDEPEHPFEPLEYGDSVETIPLFRRGSLPATPEPAAVLSTLKVALAQIRALKSHPTASGEAHGGYMDARNDAALIVEEIIDNLSMADVEPLLSLEEKMAQANRCACHGSDDYCPCQNVADRETRLARKNTLTIDT